MSLIIAGLGVKFLSHLTIETEKVIRNSSRVLFLTNDNAYPTFLKSLNSNVDSLNNLYFSASEREVSYKKIKERILSELNQYEDVCVLIYGHPIFLVQSTQQAALIAEENGFTVNILPGISALDCLLADLRINPGEGGLQAFDATELLIYEKKIETSSHLIIFQIAAIGLSGHLFDDTFCKKGVKLLSEYLESNYGADFEVVLYEASQYPTIPAKIVRCKLGELDKMAVTDISTLYIPPMNKAKKNLEMVEKIKSFFTDHDASPEESRIR